MPPVDMPVPPGPQQGGGSISLATLIDYSLQRTHHELVVLSELLPRKTDMERKIEIFQFASRTRQLFVRLLALVKWATSATKVDKCTDICNFLEQQSMFFIDTADSLARLARDTLGNARLPSFSLPSAIDVLTTGTYPRLPTCIREKIVPPDPITPQEKKDTLHRLNQVIQYRLVSSELPPQMRKLRIEQGRVKFTVEHEFEVTLTLMGDSSTIPWRLLDIDILVEDHETGDGKSLVHSLQVNYIHRLAQTRLLDNDKPLHDLYRVLHSFCQALQLEVLNSQTQRLIKSRLGDSVRVEEYTLSRRLLVSYWRDQTKNCKSADPVIYKLSVHVCEEDDGKPLQITHFPPMSPEECTKVGLAIKSDQLSIEKLLMQTIEVRTYAKLRELSKEMQRYVSDKCEIRDMPAALHVPILSPCMPSEVLRIAIDVLRGTYLASVPAYNSLAIQEIEDCLNNDKRGFDKAISKLRLQLSLLRCEKSVQLLLAPCFHTLPIVNMAGHELEKLSKTRLFIGVPRQHYFYIVVELEEKIDTSVDFKYYFLQTKPCTIDGTEEVMGDDSVVKFFLKAEMFLPLHIHSITRGPVCKIFDDSPYTTLDSLSRKRKLYLGEGDEPDAKKIKGSPYFIPELTYLLASTEEKIPFIYLGQELNSHNISHQGIQIDGEGVCMALTILDFPNCKGCPEEVTKMLKELFLSCKFRILSRFRNWNVEFIFDKSPLESEHYKESGPSQRVYLNLDLNSDDYQKTVKDLLNEWNAIGNLFGLVQDFVDVYSDVRSGFQSVVKIKSYNYKKLVISYGQGLSCLVIVKWNGDDGLFHLSLGTNGQCSTGNPHVPVLTHLEKELNTSKNLSYLIQVLLETMAPMASMIKLNTLPVLGTSQIPKISMLTFTIVPQSSTHLRIIYRNIYCVDVHLRANKIVAVRDCSYSHFDNSSVVDALTPTPGLKAFLNMFVDETAIGGRSRRRSTTEDDNPPSPMDTMDIFSHPSTGSPATRPPKQDLASNFRFQNPMTPPSNPHTPASPGAARMPTGINPSPSTALMGAPSPSTLLTGESPGNPHLHVPSPSSLIAAPSPQSIGMHMQSPAASFMSPSGMVEGGSPYPGSNFAHPSPRNWPGSPSVVGSGPSPASYYGATSTTSPGHPALHSPQNQVLSPPSRILPKKSWAASIPTLLSHDAFDKMLTPGPLQAPVMLSPLERFLGCNILKRHFNKLIQMDQALTFIPCAEPGVIMFKAETLQFMVKLNMSTLQTLHMKVTPNPESADQWTTEETQIMEKYFDQKIACYPYKINALSSFTKIFNAPIRILKDFIQIMRLELMPDQNMKWSIRWCLTIPHDIQLQPQPGTPCVIVKAKVLIVIQLTRIGINLPPGKEAQSINIPLLYDLHYNTVNFFQYNDRGQNKQLTTPTAHAIMVMLTRFGDLHQNPNECALFPAIRELMTNLVLPM
ncbi:mediator of RNA polymerase II transcription subunit 14 [Patella vulgata]|uniref:mediator of RNA polymerase II transcription subunit 14 n=1 Tax=Patella vulgata TaxID=6465 RepID=UPI00217F384F|nr:mediator of RNA polymerase II transcription subunit 14 [Patella vulgata]